MRFFTVVIKAIPTEGSVVSKQLVIDKRADWTAFRIKTLTLATYPGVLK
jgi:hypothetical protein